MNASSLFPHESVREEQGRFMSDVYDSLSRGVCLIAHAPTGMGKTAASLAPALSFALQKKLTVFFLTSRHTQHALALDTLRQIRQRHGVKFSVTDIVGKKHMCAQEGISALSSRQFHEFCRALRENGQCRFYSNLKRGSELTVDTKLVVDALRREPCDTERTVELGKMHTVCPYEAAAVASQDSSVIIADYYYLFNQSIRDGFLKKVGKELEDCIIIVDEGHNLPERMREMLTERLTSSVVERGVKEAERFAEDSDKGFLVDVGEALASLSEEGKENERLVAKDAFLKLLEHHDVESVIERLGKVADRVREEQRQSYIGSIVEFLDSWVEGEEEGYARIVSRNQGFSSVSLSYRCLDPAVGARRVIHEAHSVVLMSGTLTPTRMYREILGFPEGTVEREYRNPFPRQNRLALVVNGATTQFSKRDESQFRKISDVCVDSSNEIPGNVAIFFPSYHVLGEAHRLIHSRTQKNVFVETPGITKDEKLRLLMNFRMSYLTGGLLLAVVGGSFYEGIDLPGELLNGVIIVGLPLAQPDLETKKLIEHYDTKYGKGWDYGYVLPAFTKAMQSAGRCIRTEKDRGVILFVDDRYAWKRYYDCFPKDWMPKVTSFYREHIRDFFTGRQKTL
ncbi:ATP-dependent DNA helicase [Candidatus Woesearchaeota archaeon]|nr:ATP-dependent DNA helicase [Candidatus Woesearchaeota archaeon]